MMNWILARLLEPSTQGGLSLLSLILSGFLPNEWKPIAQPAGQFAAAVFASLAVVMAEKPKPMAPIAKPKESGGGPGDGGEGGGG